MHAYKNLVVGAALVLSYQAAFADYGTGYKIYCTQPRFSDKADENRKPTTEITFYGDSRMESTCYDVNNVLKTYETTLPQAVAKELGIDYGKIKERGRDSTSTAKLSNGGYTPQWAWDRADANAQKQIYFGGDESANTKVLVLAFGTNDVWEDKANSNNQPVFKERLRRMTVAALEDGKAVVLVEPYRACKYGSYFPNQPDDQALRISFLQQALQPYVDDIRGIDSELNGISKYAGRVQRAALFDIDRTRNFDCSDVSLDTADGLHASQGAILRFAKVIAEAIAKVYPVVSTSINNTALDLGGGSAIFSWNAPYAAQVDAQCSGGVAGTYSGPSQKNGIYAQPVLAGPGSCTAVAKSVTGLTAQSSQTVFVRYPTPVITTSISKASLMVGENRAAIFSWNASNANSVAVQCEGSVTGTYSGTSLTNGIYAEAVSVGSGRCTATAKNALGQTASSSQMVSVQSNDPVVTSVVNPSTLTLGGNAAIFSWSASNATSVSVSCIGSVSGSYAGASLENGIYARPVSTGPGSCTVTATNVAGRTAASRADVSVK